MGRLGKKERRFLAEILYGFITRDYQRIAEVHFEAGYVPPHHAVELRPGDPRHRRADPRPAGREISMAKLLTLLFEVTELFDMQTRPELVLLQKTMVVVEGVARTLDPDFNMWETAEPVVGDWIERNLGPAACSKTPRRARARSARFLGGVPGTSRPRGARSPTARRRDARRAGALAGNGRGDRPGRGAPHRWTAWRCG